MGKKKSRKIQENLHKSDNIVKNSRYMSDIYQLLALESFIANIIINVFNSLEQKSYIASAAQQVRSWTPGKHIKSTEKVRTISFT